MMRERERERERDRETERERDGEREGGEMGALDGTLSTRVREGRIYLVAQLAVLRVAAQRDERRGAVEGVGVTEAVLEDANIRGRTQEHERRGLRETLRRGGVARRGDGHGPCSHHTVVELTDRNLIFLNGH
jgi:hypothetical protein